MPFASPPMNGISVYLDMTSGKEWMTPNEPSTMIDTLSGNHSCGRLQQEC